MMKKLLIVLFLLTEINAFAQDPHFSQFYANPLYLNPAFAGSAICPRLVTNYRNQWPAISGTYVTYNASYDQYFENLSGGVGILAYTDDAGQGTLKTSMISGIYSFSTPINRYFSIKAGFQASYYQESLDWSKLTFGDMINPKLGFIYANITPMPASLRRSVDDFSSGILAYSDRFYAGIAVNHLTKPNIGFMSVSRLPRRYTVHAGGIIDLEHHRRRRIEDPVISPNILFMKQQDFEQLNYGLYMSKYPFVGGLWFRQGFSNPDAFIALIGIQTSVVNIGYTYDLTVSRLTNASGGSHEVSLTVKFGCPVKIKRIRRINCPAF